MGTFNFTPDCNTPYKAVFCKWEDHDAYKEDVVKEHGEEEASLMVGCTGNDSDYSDWYASEKENYMRCLKEDLEKAFGHCLNDFDANACDKQRVCRIGYTFVFAGMNFYIEVGIWLEVGYYEGFALDWQIDEMLDCYNDEVPDFDTAVNYLEDGCSTGLARMLAPKFIKRCERELHSITDKLDDILMHLAPHCMTIGWCCGEHKDEFK